MKRPLLSQYNIVRFIVIHYIQQVLGSYIWQSVLNAIQHRRIIFGISINVFTAGWSPTGDSTEDAFVQWNCEQHRVLQHQFLHQFKTFLQKLFINPTRARQLWFDSHPTHLIKNFIKHLEVVHSEGKFESKSHQGWSLRKNTFFYKLCVCVCVCCVCVFFLTFPSVRGDGEANLLQQVQTWISRQTCIYRRRILKELRLT